MSPQPNQPPVSTILSDQKQIMTPDDDDSDLDPFEFQEKMQRSQGLNVSGGGGVTIGN